MKIRALVITSNLAFLTCLLINSTAAAAEGRKVRDAMWAWAHYEGAYNDAPMFGLPRKSSITPIQGAEWLGLTNLILIRWEDKPRSPFQGYASSLRPLKRVMWSVTTPNGLSSTEDEDHVFSLAAQMPNITGLFMDDFFHIKEYQSPQWLAENNAQFPIQLTVKLPAPIAIDKLDLAQSCWRSHDYRSAGIAVDVSEDQEHFEERFRGTMPNVANALVRVPLSESRVRALRIRILGTHDTRGAKSCGLTEMRLWYAGKSLPLTGATILSSSELTNHSAANLLGDEASAPAATKVEHLRRLRDRASATGKKLDLGVTLYAHQLDKRIISHLNECDVISFWTWESPALQHLEENFARLEALNPNKRILLGLYMWDFSRRGQPMPLSLMKKQCELALKWLQEGRIEGMIFLGTNICDLNLEAANWSRSWIARVGDQPLIQK